MIRKLIKRDILVFVRDRRTVLICAVSIFLIIGLFALFLGRMFSDWVSGMFACAGDPRHLVDSWIIAGVLEINSAVISLSVLGLLIYDAESGRLLDFTVSPVSRNSLVLGHFLSALAIGFLYGLAGLFIGELYIVLAGGQWLSLMNLGGIIGLLALCTLSSASVMFFIVLLIKSASVYNTINSLTGTFLGFLASVYIPVGVFPQGARYFVSALPFGIGSAALRQIFCRQPLADVFSGSPEQSAAFEKMFGLTLYWGEEKITMLAMLLILAGTAVLFLALSAIRMKSYTRK